MRLLAQLRWLLLALAAGLGSPPVAADPAPQFAVRDGARPLPRRLLLLAPDVRVHEVSAGGVIEKVPRFTDAASRRFSASLAVVATSGTDPIELVGAPVLSPDELEGLSDLIARYGVVAAGVRQALTGGGPWRSRVEHFDYTLGEGLPALAHKTKVDAMLITTGQALVESQGRSAMNIAGSFASALLSQGRSLSFHKDDRAALSFGVVDLNTGNILWMRTGPAPVAVFMDDARNRAFVAQTIGNYLAPGKP